MRPMPYDNILVEALSISFNSLTIYRPNNVRQSARRARTRHLQLKTWGKFEDLPTFNELWHAVKEEAAEDVDNNKNSCATR